MSTHFLKQTVGWGFGLWLFGYLLGFFFFTLRGDMMNGMAYTSGFVFSYYLVFCFYKIANRLNNMGFT
jgi:hypothetical protein